MYHELVGRKFAVFNISSQHPRFPIYRRMLHSSLNPRIIQDYGPLLDKESRILLDNIASTPQKFIQHFRRWVSAGSVLLRQFMRFLLKECWGSNPGSCIRLDCIRG